MKICTRCKIEKDGSEFRYRWEKRINKCKDGIPFQYLNSRCIDCEREVASEYHNKKKTDPEYRKKAVDRAKKCREKKPEKYKSKSKAYRESERGKSNRKRYYKENKERILILNRKNNIKYTKRLRETLDDKYVLNNMSRDMGMSKKEVKDKYPELLDFTKKYIQLLRQTKKQIYGTK